MATERLPPVNLIIRDTLLSRAPGSEKFGQFVALTLTEFDDVRYMLLHDKDDMFQLSMSLPSDPTGAAGSKARRLSDRCTHYANYTTRRFDMRAANRAAGAP